MRGDQRPIAVFDSGVGGLTVLKALMEALPQESFIYLADTARLPYGTKTPESIYRYTHQCAQLLFKYDIKLLVVACNTASSVALAPLQVAYPQVPILGVIEPGAEAAVRASQNQHIAVIGTEGTIKQRAYDKAIKAKVPSATVRGRACQLLVALAEEGWHEGELVEAILARYLDSLLNKTADFSPDTLVLGCTHFPVFRKAIRAVVGEKIKLVDSAHTTAMTVKAFLEHHHFLKASGEVIHHFLATEGPERFAKLASKFLELALEEEDVELVDLI